MDTPETPEKRKPGRPPGRRLTVTVQVLVSEDEADAMYHQAQRRRLPLSILVREACRRAGLMEMPAAVSVPPK
jgi:hypothetical protein